MADPITQAREITASSKTVRSRFKTFTRESTDRDETRWKHVLTLKFDDECENGHNTFTATVAIYRNGREYGGGADHEEIARVWPEFAPYLKWQLCSTAGPMHYIANTTHFAGDRDAWGKRKGEPCHPSYYVQLAEDALLVKWPEKGFEHFGPRIVEFNYGPHAEEMARAVGGTVVEFVKQYHEGKERQFDLARKSAIWPEATDEELMSDDLEDRLIARLPALLAEFRRDMESLGCEW
jgi:hypothetical protein